jgi:RNA polymerase sigma-70 factor (ECF subfamily)
MKVVDRGRNALDRLGNERLTPRRRLALQKGKTPMLGYATGRASRGPEAVNGMDQRLNREFEDSLAESSTLAFRVAFSVLRQRQDAEDVAQEAFLKAFRAFHQLRDRERFRSWLVRITWRLAIDRRRGDQRRKLREQVDVESSLNAEGVDAMIGRERAEHLWHAIDALPEKLRVVVVLAGIEEHDLRAVARLLGLAEGTVRSRLFTARKRLNEFLQ